MLIFITFSEQTDALAWCMALLRGVFDVWLWDLRKPGPNSKLETKEVEGSLYLHSLGTHVARRD